MCKSGFDSRWGRRTKRGGAKQSNCLLCVRELKTAAIFCEYAEPRGGVATSPSDGEEKVVADSRWGRKIKNFNQSSRSLFSAYFDGSSSKRFLHSSEQK